MKNILSVIVTALILFSASAQNNVKGIYNWTQNLTQAGIHNAKISGFQGMRVMLKWDALQTDSTDYSLTRLKQIVNLCADSAINLEVELWVGPDAPINNPVNWLRLSGVDTFYTSGSVSGRAPGPYPTYYSDIYKHYYLKLFKAVADTIFALPDSRKLYLKSFFVCNGSTGDGQPIHGTPSPGHSIYADPVLWDAYKKVQWDSVWHYFSKDTSFMKLAFQPEDAATNLLYCLQHFPGSYLKNGSPGHEYPVDGEIYRRYWPAALYLTEIDAGGKAVTPTKATCAQSNLQLVRSALECKLSRLDFMTPFWDTISDRHFLANFFNLYCRQFFVPNDSISRGFVALADKINMRDTVVYPIGTYGALYNSTSAYNALIAAINADTTTTEYAKQVKRTNAAITQRNTTRMANLATAGLAYKPIGEFLYNDVSWDNTPNYSLWITQLLVTQTSLGQWRIGDTTQSYGRNVRIFKKYNNYYKMYFDVNDTLASGSSTNNVRITVTYYDSGYATWQVQCYQCYKNTINNHNTRTFKQAVINIPAFRFGNLMPNGSDIVIRLYKSTDGDSVVNFPIEMVQFENLTKE